MFKRLLPVAGAAGILSVALAGSAVAGGGPGYGGPGIAKYSDMSANAGLSDPTGTRFAFVFVDRGMQSFKAKRTPGAPVTEEFGTVLNVSDPVGYGCWIIPDSAFSVANDLSSASLNVTTNAAEACPGYYVGPAAGGKPGVASGPVAFGGGGGGGGGGTQLTSVTVSLSWTWDGKAWSSQSVNDSHCGSFNAHDVNSYAYAFSTASGSISDITGTVSDPFATLASASATFNQNGSLSSACNPFGF